MKKMTVFGVRILALYFLILFYRYLFMVLSIFEGVSVVDLFFFINLISAVILWFLADTLAVVIHNFKFKKEANINSDYFQLYKIAFSITGIFVLVSGLAGTSGILVSIAAGHISYVDWKEIPVLVIKIISGCLFLFKTDLLVRALIPSTTKIIKNENHEF